MIRFFRLNRAEPLHTYTWTAARSHFDRLLLNTAVETVNNLNRGFYNMYRFTEPHHSYVKQARAIICISHFFTATNTTAPNVASWPRLQRKSAALWSVPSLTEEEEVKCWTLVHPACQTPVISV